MEPNFQSSLRKVIETFQNAVKKIENEFIPLFHSNTSPEDECKLERMAQKVIAGNLKQVWKIIGGGNLTEILSSECEDNENNSSLPFESTTQENSSLVNNKEDGSIINRAVDTEAISETVQERNTENSPDLNSSIPPEEGYAKNDIRSKSENSGALDHGNDDFEERRDETGNSQTCNDEVGMTSTSVAPVANVSTNANSEFQDTLTSVSNLRVYNEIESVVVPCDESVPRNPEISTNTAAQDGAMETSQKSGDDENYMSSEFQDTPTSVSEFRAYNYNKNTLGPITKKPPWREKCESYVKMLDAIGNLPDSQESLMSNENFGDTDDDNITSVSHLNEVKETVNVTKPKKSSMNSELLNEDSNKENSPVNSSCVEAEHESSKQPVEIQISDDSDDSNDSIEIVKDMNPHLDQIPILLGADDESKTVDVGDIKNNHSLSCVSVNNLKNHVQPSQNNDVERNERTNNVIGNELMGHINLTGDNDVDNLDREIDLLIGDSDNETLLTNNHIDSSTSNHSTVPTTETCKGVPEQSELNENKAKDNTVIPCESYNSTDLTPNDDEVNAESEAIVLLEDKTKYPNNDNHHSRRSQNNILSSTEPNENIADKNSTESSRPDSTLPKISRALSESDSSIFKQESLHIVDDIMLTDSQENGFLNSQFSEEMPNILSENGNFMEDEGTYDKNGYEVIPSVKVEVVMKEENDSDRNVYMNENLCHESTAPNKTTKRIKKIKSRKKIKKEKMLKALRNSEIQKSAKIENCEVEITNATRNISPIEVKCEKIEESSNYIFKIPGPKSKTIPKKTLGESSSDKLSQEIRKLTNLSGLNKSKSYGKSGTRNIVKHSKAPTLLDFYDESELSTQNFISSSQEIDEALCPVVFLNPINITAEEMAKNRILQSDDDDDESLSSMGNNNNRKSKEKFTTSLKKSNHTNSRKPIPSWKKDKLLTANLDSPKLNFKRNKTKNVEDNADDDDDDDDDVQSVCSQMQMKIRNPTLRENLKKLVDHKDTVINDITKENQLIIISSSEEEDEEDENTDNCVNDDDDIDSVLTESNNKELISKFKTTAQIRKREVSILQKRAQKIITKTRVHQVSCSSQEIATFEDRYKDIPPLVLDIDEETGDVVSASPFYTKILKEHQKRGLHFMWDTCFGSKKKISEDEGSGCILAHDMGLGKSLQVIALLHTLKCQEDLPLKRILILSPKSLVQNWEDEITKWTKGLQVKLTVYSWQTDTDLAVQDLHEWSAHGGVYILGYQMFAIVCKKIVPVAFSAFFLNPGPDVVICDEAHLLKNSRTDAHRFLTLIQTKRRIALTGTPIQNNLEELYNIVSLVQPKFMTKERFREHFIIPISRAQDGNATTSERDKAAKRISVLHKELEKVMDREQGNQEVGLPPKLNYDIFLNLEPLQKKLYKFFCEKMKLCFVQPMIFPAVRLAEIISIHPKSLETSKPVEELCKGKDWNEELRKGNDWHADLKGAWWKNVLTENEINQLKAKEAGVKIKVAFQILENAIQKNEKVLIFCNAKQILNLMQCFLEENSYVKNVNYFRLDGSVTFTLRKKYLNIFNDENNTDAKVFLMTHKVGGVGLNFAGASRIIILDMPWNPSHHEQSSNRTYRLGQKKTSYIYRLITKGTLEENIYKTTVAKQSLSKRVVDKKKIKSKFKAQDTFDFKYEDIRRPRRDLPPAKDELLNSIFQNSDEQNIIHSYSEQGELFELSEEQLNEGQAYEEYLLESRNFDVPRETNCKRRRKLKLPPVVDESVPSSMMTKDHLDNYNHSELLSRMSEFSQPNRNLYSYASSEGSQQEPINFSRSNDINADIPMPPPLVPIPRGKFSRKKPTNNINPSQKSSHSLGDEAVVNQGKTTELERLLNESIPQNTNSLSPNSNRYTSITDFINSCLSKPLCPNENTDILLEKLSKSTESAVLTRPLTVHSNGIDSTLVENSTMEPFSSVSNKVRPKKRLSINPDIFIQSLLKPSEQEQQHQNSQSQLTTNVNKKRQNIRDHDNHSEQLQTEIQQQITQQSRKRGLQPNQVSDKRRRIQASINESDLKNVEQQSPLDSTFDSRLKLLDSAILQRMGLLNSNDVSQHGSSDPKNVSHEILPKKMTWKNCSPSQSPTLEQRSLPNHPRSTAVHQKPSVSVTQKPPVNDQKKRPGRNSPINQTFTSQPGTSFRTNTPVVRLNNQSFELTSDTVDEFLDRLPRNYDLSQCLVSCLLSMLTHLSGTRDRSRL